MRIEDAKLLWRCRRGARELDSLLVPYGLMRINVMDEVEKYNLRFLLEQQDPDLLDWFLGRRTPNDVRISAAIDNVLEFRATRQHVGEPYSAV